MNGCTRMAKRMKPSVGCWRSVISAVMRTARRLALNFFISILASNQPNIGVFQRWLTDCYLTDLRTVQAVHQVRQGLGTARRVDKERLLLIAIFDGNGLDERKGAHIFHSIGL